MSENYPDDIRSFDHVPGSPYYVDPNEWREDMAEDFRNEFEETGSISVAGYDYGHADIAEYQSEGFDWDESVDKMIDYCLDRYEESQEP